ncbi:MAG: hypothetical protein CM1200mP2_19360 [Planctomycetaceae bacterium]|nr:MAG: hypothetical protein CM1200mP2_19360 [Planctomycetaceae bacterium]
MNYGLGAPSKNLPGYIVLAAGPAARGGATLYSSGFLPSTVAGVLFRSKGEPVLNLNNPKGLTSAAQRISLDALKGLNKRRSGRWVTRNQQQDFGLRTRFLHADGGSGPD